MSAGELGPIPPRDPAADEAQRAALQRQRNETGLFVLMLFGQLALAAALGHWAAAGWDDPQQRLGAQAAAGMLLALLGAHVVGYGALLLFGGVALLTMLPRLFRRAPPAPAPGPPPRGEDAFGKVLIAGVVAVHGAVLLAGALVLCLLLAWSSAAAGIGAWWRFALAALALVPVTARLLVALSRSDA
jgi:hypothetical protein